MNAMKAANQPTSSTTTLPATVLDQYLLPVTNTLTENSSPVLASSHPPRIFRLFLRAKTMTNSIRKPASHPSPPRVGSLSITARKRVTLRMPRFSFALVSSFWPFFPSGLCSLLHLGSGSVLPACAEFTAESFIPIRSFLKGGIEGGFVTPCRSLDSVCNRRAELKVASLPFPKSRLRSAEIGGRISERICVRPLETNHTREKPRQIRFVCPIIDDFLSRNNSEESSSEGRRESLSCRR